MKPLKPIGIDVDGKKVGLENFLLDMPGRAIPKEPTHYVVADIVNTDLSVKRITIYFNEADYWINPESQFGQRNFNSVGRLIGGHLGFLSLDKATMAYKYWIVNVATNDVVSFSGCLVHCKNYDY